MSLQGSLDTFALPDVLRLLASTAKTGHLRVDGSRASGDLWIDAGHVVAAEIDDATLSRPAVEVVFELLRSTEGDFAFAGDMTTSGAGAPLDVEPLLEEAEALLTEWREIEAVVPSLGAWVALAPELPKSSVMVQAEQWRLVAAIGSGTRVGDLGDSFGMSELDISRRVKGLVEAGLATIGTEADHGESGHIEAEPVAEVTTSKRTRRTPTGEGRVAKLRPVEPVLDELAALADAEPAGPDASELARQLSELGPEAAQAVAAAAQAETDEEREAALAAISTDADGEPINRGLLLKFLSSVRS